MLTSSKMIAVSASSNVELFSMRQSYNRDSFQHKVNLVMLQFLDDNDEPFVFPIVSTIERLLVVDETVTNMYTPILGLEAFNFSLVELILGTDSKAINERRAFAVQASTSTGSIRIGAEFLSKVMGYKYMYDSIPSWENYMYIFAAAGFEPRKFRYWSASTKKLALADMLEDLRSAPENSVIVLQVSGHNPTGCDPTKEEWRAIADVMDERKLFPFFDCRYLGLVTGDFDEDAWAVRYFVSRRFELFCAISLTASFNLQSDRPGALIVVLNTSYLTIYVKSHLVKVIMGLYSNPPLHGAVVVTYILHNHQCREQWKHQLRTVCEKLQRTRKALRTAIEKQHTPGNWTHITSQRGIFCTPGLNEAQAKTLIGRFHIYLLKNGRICLTGITKKNISYISKSIRDVVTHVK